MGKVEPRKEKGKKKSRKWQEIEGIEGKGVQFIAEKEESWGGVRPTHERRHSVYV